MSAEMAQGDVKSHRTISERVGLRWPSVAQRTTRSVLRLPPGSRVRRAYLRRAAQIAFEAWMRGDLELVPHMDDAEVETHITQGSGVPIGFDTVYYGVEGHCRSMEIWNEAWQTWGAEIDEIIEEGRDQVLFIARIHCVGAASGIRLDEWGAVRYTFREGLILRCGRRLRSRPRPCARCAARDGQLAPPGLQAHAARSGATFRGRFRLIIRLTGARQREILRAMSQQNFEATRRIWERFLAGDTQGMLAFLDPDVEIHDAPGLPDTGVYRGRQGYLAQIEKFRDAFRDIKWEPRTPVDCGDRVLTVVDATGVGKASGISGAASFYELLTWRDGKIVRVDYFRSEEQALEAAGLRE